LRDTYFCSTQFIDEFLKWFKNFTLKKSMFVILFYEMRVGR